MFEHKDYRKILMVTDFDASELFETDLSDKAAAFHKIAAQIGATVAPTFSPGDKQNIRTEFNDAAAEVERTTAWLVFEEDIDQDTAVEVIKRFAQAGLANTGMMHVDFSPLQKNPVNPGFNI
jgi:hypothetical protein